MTAAQRGKKGEGQRLLRRALDPRATALAKGECAQTLPAMAAGGEVFVFAYAGAMERAAHETQVSGRDRRRRATVGPPRRRPHVERPPMKLRVRLSLG